MHSVTCLWPLPTSPLVVLTISLPVSVGDVVVVSVLIKDIIEALDDGRGSVIEYQEIIREL